jgi:hypothetical protein
MKYTYTVEYKNESDAPRVHKDMAALGGKVTAVAFYDALKENERMKEALQKIEDGHEPSAADIADAVLSNLR